jgi:D-alanyl-D-alanine carboxypeptidase/D-alanyl-D-alanine-endopeptidase (penicillin-binding protein 4)
MKSIFISGQPSDNKALNELWDKLNLAPRYHVGLMVYDIEKQRTIFDYKADNYFTPASNTKLLTMYAALQCLGDSLPAAYYITSGDSLIVWGGADPGTINPDIPMPSSLVDMIRNSDKEIYFSDQYFQTTRYGKGWAWDDYPFYYQCERNAFPIYGNRLWIDRQKDSITMFPHYLAPLLTITRDSFADAGKSEWGDGYFYTYDSLSKTDFEEIPITFFKNDLRYAWAEATLKDIHFIERTKPNQVLISQGSPRDSLIRYMMMDSDNFIAEQLLLASSMRILGYMNEADLIDSLMRGSLSDLQDKIAWVDGSGLSRYNMMTPRTMVTILTRILNTKGISYLMNMLPAAGKSGTLQNGYKLKNGKPYVYAKSGTLKYTHCLSGIIKTGSGKWLAFSWMHNQYPINNSDIRSAMDKFFSFLYDHY